MVGVLIELQPRHRDSQTQWRGNRVNSLTASPMEGTLACCGCTHIIARPNTLSPSAHPLVKMRRKVTSLLNLCFTPSFEACKGREFALCYGGGVEASLIRGRCHDAPR